MQYINITPEDYVERNYCYDIFNNLKNSFDDDTFLCVRNWDNENNFDNRKRIVIVTSAEGHKYLPRDQEDPKCLGVFMHYLTKTSLDKQYEKDGFVSLTKLHALPLGTTKFFKAEKIIPYKDREYDFCFIGQLDPYRRIKFYNSITSILKDYNCFVRFYTGWNNGLGGDEYSRVLHNSKMALVPWGSASLDTFRFYEAAQSGCVILSDPQNNYDFMKSSPHITTNWEYVNRVLRHILLDNKTYQISKATREFWENSLSPKACARYITERV